MSETQSSTANLLCPPLQFVTLASSVARTATGNGDSIDLTKMVDGIRIGVWPMMLLQADVTAVSGTTPSLTSTVIAVVI